MQSIVKDPALAPDGHKKIDWAAEHSPVLNRLCGEYLKDGTFEGLGVGVALPIEAKTAYLRVVLAEAGADVAVASPGPFFVQDDVAAALAERGVTVYASSEGVPEEADREMEQVLDRVADSKEAVLIDDRAGLVRLAHTTRRNLLPGIRGASEETTSGVAKFRAMEGEGVLEFPVIAANDARCKYLFDNRYGTGQSTLTAIMQNTNLRRRSRGQGHSLRGSPGVGPRSLRRRIRRLAGARCRRNRGGLHHGDREPGRARL